MSIFTKKELRRLKAGQWVTLKWNDAPDSEVLLVEKPNMEEPGEVSLIYYEPSMGRLSSLAVHTQIVAIGDLLEVPQGAA